MPNIRNTFIYKSVARLFDIIFKHYKTASNSNKIKDGTDIQPKGVMDEFDKQFSFIRDYGIDTKENYNKVKAYFYAQ